MTRKPRPLEAHERAELNLAVLNQRAEGSLRTFVQLAWRILEPTTVFMPNWHIDLICEYLEAVTAGQITRLVINMPPRHMKSLLASVLWPCWEWIQRPSGRWLFVSHTESLAIMHSLHRLRLMRSPWYQNAFGSQVILAKDQQTKREFHNTKSGGMLAASFGSSVVGKGGNRLVIDDPHDPLQVESDAHRQHAVAFLTEELSTRLNDPTRDAVVVVMQRVHMRDLAGVCLEHGYTHLCLPAFEPDGRSIVFPRSGRRHARAVNEPLWAARENAEQLDAQRRLLGSYAFSAQYQQAPVPRTENLFRPGWWQYFDERPDRFDSVIQSWDVSFKAGVGSDYVVGLVAGVRGAHVYLLDRFKAKASFVETIKAIQQMKGWYPQTQIVLIEEAANGPAIVDMLQKQIPGIVAVKPEGSKLARAQAVLPMIEARQVFLPNPRWPNGDLRPERQWVVDLIETCAMFPMAAHDDDVDALSQLLRRCQQRRGVTPLAILRAMRDDGEEYRPRFVPDSGGPPRARPFRSLRS